MELLLFLFCDRIITVEPLPSSASSTDARHRTKVLLYARRVFKHRSFKTSPILVDNVSIECNRCFSDGADLLAEGRCPGESLSLADDSARGALARLDVASGRAPYQKGRTAGSRLTTTSTQVSTTGLG